MYTFVKIKAHPVGSYDGWFLLYSGEDLLKTDSGMQYSEATRNGASNAQEFFHATMHEVVKQDWRQHDWLKRLEYTMFQSKIDYAMAYEKYKHIGKLAIRQSGSYLLLTDKFEITAIRTNEHLIWDDNTSATVGIIENDFNAEPEWMKFLSERFPNQQYRLLNLFSMMDDATISEMLKGITDITFMTTFSSFEWYERLLRNIPDQSVKIIGYCSDKTKWDEAIKLTKTNTLEIVEDLNQSVV